MPAASASSEWQNRVGQPELAHQRVGEFVEGVGQDDDDLVILAQLVEEGTRAPSIGPISAITFWMSGRPSLCWRRMSRR